MRRAGCLFKEAVTSAKNLCEKGLEFGKIYNVA
jgi:hypothetical protein